MLLTLRNFIKIFLFVLELSKSLIDFTNLKTITYFEPWFLFLWFKRSFVFIRLLKITWAPYYLTSFENTLCWHRYLNLLHSFYLLILLLSVEVAHFLRPIEKQLKVVFASQLVYHIKTKTKMYENFGLHLFGFQKLLNYMPIVVAKDLADF